MQKAEPVLLPQRRVTNMAIEIIMDWLQATLRWAAPLLIVAIGEVYAERSGVINMGIEASCFSAPLPALLQVST